MESGYCICVIESVDRSRIESDTVGVPSELHFNLAFQLSAYFGSNPISALILLVSTEHAWHAART